jgi:signal transduction histidine kinase
MVVAESGAATDRPWLWQLLNVATACAGVAFSAWWAGAYAVLVPIGFSAICMLPGGGSIPLKTAVLDAGLGIIVGVVTVILMTLFRSVGARVDKSQSDALRQFAATARAEAAETERLYVDALVHDSVLTTLLVASRAESPESRRLATAMAETAISRLESPGTFDEGGGARVAVGTLHDRLRALVSSISLPIDVTLTGDPAQTMPSAVAEAIYSATVQAVQNSLQHAGFDDQIKRFITMTVTPPAHVVVAIGDTGRGFDQASVPTERLGLSKSIIARVASVKGLATVDSAPGSGTIISIAWGDAS